MSHPKKPESVLDGDQGHLLGVHVSGWPAFVVDCLLRRYGEPYLKAMSPEQSREVDAFHRAVHVAAAYWQDRATAAVGNAEAVTTATAPPLMNEGLSCTEAATLLALSERRVRQLAANWQHEGLARKVGRSWLLDADAVRIHARRNTT